MPVGVMYQSPSLIRFVWSHRIAGSSTLIEDRLTT